MPKQFRVEWGLDLWAETPEEAAKLALEIQRDPDSIATVFTVTGRDGEVTMVDLTFGDLLKKSDRDL